MIVVGLDLSLTSTGVARIDAGTGAPVIKLDTITSKAPAARRGPKGKPLPPTLEQRHIRLHNLRLEIALRCTEADLVVVEGPSYGSKTGHQHDRSGLWWNVVDWLMNDATTADGWGKTVVEVPPSSRMKYATGKGMVSKDMVLAAVVRRYADVDTNGNDEADALILAAMGARHLGHAIEESLPQTHLAAMDAVRWPDPIGT